MRAIKSVLALLAMAIFVFWMILLFWYALYVMANKLGFDSQATPQYGFASGIGPMLLTAIGMSTLLTGMWHSLNCHEPGCYRIGRHKISGTPWCNEHHEKARGEQTADDLLRQILATLDDISSKLGAL